MRALIPLILLALFFSGCKSGKNPVVQILGPSETPPRPPVSGGCSPSLSTAGGTTFTTAETLSLELECGDAFTEGDALWLFPMSGAGGAPVYLPELTAAETISGRIDRELTAVAAGSYRAALLGETVSVQSNVFSVTGSGGSHPGGGGGNPGGGGGNQCIPSLSAPSSVAAGSPFSVSYSGLCDLSSGAAVYVISLGNSGVQPNVAPLGGTSPSGSVTVAAHHLAGEYEIRVSRSSGMNFIDGLSRSLTVTSSGSSSGGGDCTPSVPSNVPANTAFTVSYSGDCGFTSSAWAGLYQGSTLVTYNWLSAGGNPRTTTLTAYSAGSYTVKVSRNSGNDFITSAGRTLTATAGGSSGGSGGSGGSCNPSVPSSVAAGSRFSVSYPSSCNFSSSAWAGIYQGSTLVDYDYLSSSGDPRTAALDAPLSAGSYMVRVSRTGGYDFIASADRSLTVTAGGGAAGGSCNPTISVPSTVPLNEFVNISYSFPSGCNLASSAMGSLYFPSGALFTSWYLSSPSPARFIMHAGTGTYTVKFSRVGLNGDFISSAQRTFTVTSGGSGGSGASCSPSQIVNFTPGGYNTSGAAQSGASHFNRDVQGAIQASFCLAQAISGGTRVVLARPGQHFWQRVKDINGVEVAIANLGGQYSGNFTFPLTTTIRPGVYHLRIMDSSFSQIFAASAPFLITSTGNACNAKLTLSRSGSSAVVSYCGLDQPSELPATVTGSQIRVYLFDRLKALSGMTQLGSAGIPHPRTGTVTIPIPAGTSGHVIAVHTPGGTPGQGSLFINW